MEKFTREYAEKLAEANVDAIGEDFFVDGYMTCLKETNAPELKALLLELEKIVFSMDVEVDGLTMLALKAIRQRIKNATL